MKKLLPRTFIACFGIFSVIPILIGYMIVNIDTLNLVQITEPIVTLRKLYLNFSLTFLNKIFPIPKSDLYETVHVLGINDWM